MRRLPVLVLSAAVTTSAAAQVEVLYHQFALDFGVYVEWDEIGFPMQGPEFYLPSEPASGHWVQEQGDAFAEARFQSDATIISTPNQWAWAFDVDFAVEARLGASPPTSFSTAEAAIWIDGLHLEFEIDSPHRLRIDGGVFGPRDEILDPGAYILESGISSQVMVTAGPGEHRSANGGMAMRVRIILDCRVDLNGDGTLDFFDFLEFQALSTAGDPAADFNGDGVLDFFDFLEFQEEFTAGCS